MDCNAYCTANAYLLRTLYEYLQKKFKTTLYRDVIHIEVPHTDGAGDMFYFAFGSTVAWNLPKEACELLLHNIKDFENGPIEEVEAENYTFRYGKHARIKDDDITLPDTEVLTKLAASYGIAQSVKLGAFETITKKTFNLNRAIPEGLSQHGKISLSRKEIRKKMGELFLERSSINLHLDALDVPEFFWEYPELEKLYQMIAVDLDLKDREEVLNKRLGIIHELFDMLGSELNHQHSSRLEWTIILLIVVEVILTLLRDVLHLI